MEATCSTCPFWAPSAETPNSGSCRHELVNAAAETTSRDGGWWCSAHPLRQRDRLAAMAMQGILVTTSVLAAVGGPPAGTMLPEQVAADAYRIADALLTARGSR